MPTLPDLLAKIKEYVGDGFNAAEYKGFLSKRLTRSSSLAVERAGRGYHIEITNPAAEMLVFPLVTSSKYESDPDSDPAEKRRYYLRLEARIVRSNLVALLERCIADTSGELRYTETYYLGELARVSAGAGAMIGSYTHCTFQLRTSGQRQMELGMASDGQDFVCLRSCLLPEDYLILLQRGSAEYDVIGVPGESMPGDVWAGWAAGPPGHQIVESSALASSPEPRGATSPMSVEAIGPATEAKIAEVVAACERYGGRSIVALAGVPGTGKSYVAAIAAARLAGSPVRVREIQFHASFSYEEFVEGMTIGPGGEVRTKEGVFLELNAAALREPDARFVLLIEELTRANLAGVLGELLTYVEHRDRSFHAMYSRASVRIAPNLIILATYNPLDRSALEMDAALLRRMRVIDFPPSGAQLAEMLAPAGLDAAVIDRIQGLFSACEEREDHREWMPFGHGVFAGIRRERPDLTELWQERLEYMLYPPGRTKHRFADLIREHFPWTDPGFTVVSSAHHPTGSVPGDGGTAVADGNVSAPARSASAPAEVTVSVAPAGNGGTADASPGPSQ